MNPKVICHMAISADGKTILERWHPRNAVPEGLFEQAYQDLSPDAWLVGRVTGEEYARGTSPYPRENMTLPRTSWFATPSIRNPGIILDADGKLVWGTPTADGDPVVVVLTEKVSDDHLAGLRADGVSYIFAGKQELDLPLMLKILAEQLGIRTLLLQGGALTNGAFHEQGLIDELSLMLFPALDGASGSPALLTTHENNTASFRGMTLTNTSLLEGSVVWLRYRMAYLPGPKA